MRKPNRRDQSSVDLPLDMPTYYETGRNEAQVALVQAMAASQLEASDSKPATKKVSSLMDLPDELLVMIISYLDLPSIHNNGWSRADARPTLCALAITCQRMSTLVQELMLQDVKLETGWVSSIAPRYTTQRLRDFLRTCRTKPGFINYIKSLDIQADFSATPDWGATADDRVPDFLLQKLRESSSLSRLRLLLPGPAALRWLPSLFPHATIKDTLFSRLQYLYLSCGSGLVPSSSFLRLCAHRSLKHIETPSPIVTPYQMSASTAENLAWSTTGENSPRIEIISATDIAVSSSGLCRLLHQMSKLKELHMSVPGPAVAFDNHDHAHHKVFRGITAEIEEFSPSGIQMQLNPIASTLRSLSMNSPRVLVAGHDGTLLDLSNFKQLAHLKLSIHFLCPASLRDAREMELPNPTPRIPTKDFYRLLPQSLQTLEIHYDSDQGIFYDPHHLYAVYHIEDVPTFVFPAARGVSNHPMLCMMYNDLWKDRINNIAAENGVQSRLGWLLALKDLRPRVLPKLTVVTVRETYAQEWAWKDLDLVDQHRNLFSDEMLKINVSIRVPKKWNPPICEVLVAN